MTPNRKSGTEFECPPIFVRGKCNSNAFRPDRNPDSLVTWNYRTGSQLIWIHRDKSDVVLEAFQLAPSGRNNTDLDDVRRWSPRQTICRRIASHTSMTRHTTRARKIRLETVFHFPLSGKYWIFCFFLPFFRTDVGSSLSRMAIAQFRWCCALLQVYSKK